MERGRSKQRNGRLAGRGGGGGRFGSLALISHDAKRAGSNIGDRANCDRQQRSSYRWMHATMKDL